MNPSDSFGPNWHSIALQIINILMLILAIVATVVVLGHTRGRRLAFWIFVIWFLPVIGPLVALKKGPVKSVGH